MNEKLMQALEGNSWTDDAKAALHILSAIRGPDTTGLESDWLKEEFTAPIRLWALGRDHYELGGYYPSFDTWSIHAVPKSLTEELTKAVLFKVAGELKKYDSTNVDERDRARRNYHYLSHIKTAFQAIQGLENWKL